MRDRLDSFWAKDATKTVLASLASIVIGLLVGCVVILVVGYTSDNLSGKSAWEGVRIVLASIFSTGRSEGALTFGFNPVSTGNMLFRATPLIMTGLSVAVAFKTGLFNIGAPGQYLMGTMASLMIALGIPSDVVPPAIIWLLAFLGGAAAGAIWGCIPGLVKAYLNINEVLASIMTNWIAANAVTWAFEVSNFKNVVENTKTNYLYKTSFNGVATSKMGLDQLFPGSQVNGGIIIAIVIAVLMYILINKTTLGYQLKACGSNRHAARYAGIKDKRNIVLSMAIAGALSGAGAVWGCIPGLVKAYLNINEVLASIMTNWIAANAVTWAFEVSNFKNVVENTKTNYIYKTTFNGVETAKMGLDKLFPGSQVNGGIIVAIVIAILMYILINKTTLGYQLKACGSNRHAARYAGIKDKRNIVLSMAIAGALSGAGAALYYLSGNTEFYWQTYQSLPATGFNGIPVALLAANNPVGVIFTGIFMSMLDISGQQLTSLTPYNEYLTDVIIAVIVYLSAFSLVIKMLFTGRKKRKAAEAAPAEPEPAVTAAETPAVEAAAVPDAPPEDECSGKGGGEA